MERKGRESRKGDYGGSNDRLEAVKGLEGESAEDGGKEGGISF